MKSVKKLKNPDIVIVNGEKFQVIENKSLWYNKNKQELEMAIELVKVGESRITPNYRLTYIYGKPEIMKFFIYDKKNKFKKRKLKSVEL